MHGIGRAYLITPSSEKAEAQQKRFTEIAAKAGVQQLVKLSQFAADEASPVRFLRWHASVERQVRELGIDFTFLRPNLYFQGLLAFSRSISKESRFFAPIGDARVSAVDVRDVATVAAAALTEPGHQGRTYTITGPAAITHREIAATSTSSPVTTPTLSSGAEPGRADWSRFSLSSSPLERAAYGGRRRSGRSDAMASCGHLGQIRDVQPSTTEGCTDCLRTGGRWVHLRECLSCGHVGCCDSSPNRHASAHFRAEGHPLIRSFEPGEDWRWCFVDLTIV